MCTKLAVLLILEVFRRWKLSFISSDAGKLVQVPCEGVCYNNIHTVLTIWKLYRLEFFQHYYMHMQERCMSSLFILLGKLRQSN